MLGGKKSGFYFLQFDFGETSFCVLAKLCANSLLCEHQQECHRGLVHKSKMLAVVCARSAKNTTDGYYSNAHKNTYREMLFSETTQACSNLNYKLPAAQ